MNALKMAADFKHCAKKVKLRPIWSHWIERFTKVAK